MSTTSRRSAATAVGRRRGCSRWCRCSSPTPGWNAASYVAEEIRDPGRNVPRALALGHAGGGGDLPAAEHALSVRVAGGRAGRRARQRARRDRRPAARLARRRHHGRRLDRQSAGEHQRDGLRRAARLLRDGPRRHVLPGGRPRPSHASARRPRRSSRRRVWSTRARADRQRQRARPPTPGSRSCSSTAWRSRRCSCCARREPNAPRPYSTWGYPVVPGLFVVVSAVIVANALWTDLVAPLTSGRPMGPSAAGLLIIALGLPLYAWFNRTAHRGSAGRCRRAIRAYMTTAGGGRRPSWWSGLPGRR